MRRDPDTHCEPLVALLAGLEPRLEWRVRSMLEASRGFAVVASAEHGGRLDIDIALVAPDVTVLGEPLATPRALMSVGKDPPRATGPVVVTAELVRPSFARALMLCGAAAVFGGRVDPRRLVAACLLAAKGLVVDARGASIAIGGLVLDGAEADLLALLDTDLRLAEIAEVLTSTRAAVKSQAMRLYRRLGLAGRHELRDLFAEPPRAGHLGGGRPSGVAGECAPPCRV
jgi:DNA-binding NarL/FixJ family response regulator